MNNDNHKLKAKNQSVGNPSILLNPKSENQDVMKTYQSSNNKYICKYISK